MNTKLYAPVPLSAARAKMIAPLVPGLIRATGPVSYDYQFGTAGLLERVVAASWSRPETLFAGSNATAVFDGDALAGIELGFYGPDFYRFKDNLAALAGDLIARGIVGMDELVGLSERAGNASYLNAHVPEGVYYIHALATPVNHRGRGAGKVLLHAAIDRARVAGHRELQLDVLADNSAVGFYQANGLSVLSETRSPDLSRDHGFPSELRMAVAL